MKHRGTVRSFSLGSLIVLIILWNLHVSCCPSYFKQNKWNELNT